MEVKRAEYAGACYGVVRALELANEALETSDDVCTLGEIIHNPRVVNELHEKGARVVEDNDEITGTCILRSHGVKPSVEEKIEKTASRVVDATCPYVKKAQLAAKNLALDGKDVVVVGEPGHPEVESIRDYAKEGVAARKCQAANQHVYVVANPDEVPPKFKNPFGVGVVSQTTQKLSNFEAVVAMVKEITGEEPEVKNTVCSATEQRQEAAAELAKEADLMIVLGGKNSSNTTRLYEICKEHCAHSHHIESIDEVEPILKGFNGSVIGITAGASTPIEQVDELERAVRVTVKECFSRDSLIEPVVNGEAAKNAAQSAETPLATSSGSVSDTSF